MIFALDHELHVHLAQGLRDAVHVDMGIGQRCAALANTPGMLISEPMAHGKRWA